MNINASLYTRFGYESVCSAGRYNDVPRTGNAKVVKRFGQKAVLARENDRSKNGDPLNSEYTRGTVTNAFRPFPIAPPLSALPYRPYRRRTVTAPR